MAKQKIDDSPIVWESTDFLMQHLNEENPRDHFEEDIKDIALSLLRTGWAEIGVCRQQDGPLLGGHGRVMAADWLLKQDPDWFEHEWKKWTKSPEREAIAHLHQERFTPDYWAKCPVKINNLDPLTQKAVMIRLNNQAKDGRDNPKRLAALLVQMPKDLVEQSGFDQGTARSFMAAFVERKATVEEPPEETEFQGKQHFERQDATDYSYGEETEDDSLADATAESGPVESYYGSGFEDEFGDYSGDFGEETGNPSAWERPAAPPPPAVKIADVDTSNVGDFTAGVFDHTKEFSETRAVLYFSYDELNEYKRLASHAANVLGIDKEGNIAKIWRSKAMIAALKLVEQLHPPTADETPPPDDDEE